MIRTARWILVLAAVAASVNVITVVEPGSASVTDTLLGSLPWIALIWAVAGVAILVLNRRESQETHDGQDRRDGRDA